MTQLCLAKPTSVPWKHRFLEEAAYWYYHRSFTTQVIFLPTSCLPNPQAKWRNNEKFWTVGTDKTATVTCALELLWWNQLTRNHIPRSKFQDKSRHHTNTITLERWSINVLPLCSFCQTYKLTGADPPPPPAMLFLPPVVQQACAEGTSTVAWKADHCLL